MYQIERNNKQTKRMTIATQATELHIAAVPESRFYPECEHSSGVKTSLRDKTTSATGTSKVICPRNLSVPTRKKNIKGSPKETSTLPIRQRRSPTTVQKCFSKPVNQSNDKCILEESTRRRISSDRGVHLNNLRTQSFLKLRQRSDLSNDDESDPELKEKNYLHLSPKIERSKSTEDCCPNGKMAQITVENGSEGESAPVMNGKDCARLRPGTRRLSYSPSVTNDVKHKIPKIIKSSSRGSAKFRIAGETPRCFPNSVRSDSALVKTIMQLHTVSKNNVKEKVLPKSVVKPIVFPSLVTGPAGHDAGAAMKNQRPTRTALKCNGLEKQNLQILASKGKRPVPGRSPPPGCSPCFSSGPGFPMDCRLRPGSRSPSPKKSIFTALRVSQKNVSRHSVQNAVEIKSVTEDKKEDRGKTKVDPEILLTSSAKNNEPTQNELVETKQAIGEMKNVKTVAEQALKNPLPIEKTKFLKGSNPSRIPQRRSSLPTIGKQMSKEELARKRKSWKMDRSPLLKNSPQIEPKTEDIKSPRGEKHNQMESKLNSSQYRRIKEELVSNGKASGKKKQEDVHTNDRPKVRHLSPSRTILPDCRQTKEKLRSVKLKLPSPHDVINASTKTIEPVVDHSTQHSVGQQNKSRGRNHSKDRGQHNPLMEPHRDKPLYHNLTEPHHGSSPNPVEVTESEMDLLQKRVVPVPSYLHQDTARSCKSERVGVKEGLFLRKLETENDSLQSSRRATDRDNLQRTRDENFAVSRSLAKSKSTSDKIPYFRKLDRHSEYKNGIKERVSTAQVKPRPHSSPREPLHDTVHRGQSKSVEADALKLSSIVERRGNFADWKPGDEIIPKKKEVVNVSGCTPCSQKKQKKSGTNSAEPSFDITGDRIVERLFGMGVEITMDENATREKKETKDLNKDKIGKQSQRNLSIDQMLHMEILPLREANSSREQEEKIAGSSTLSIEEKMLMEKLWKGDVNPEDQEQFILENGLLQALRTEKLKERRKMESLEKLRQLTFEEALRQAEANRREKIRALAAAKADEFVDILPMRLDRLIVKSENFLGKLNSSYHRTKNKNGGSTFLRKKLGS